MRLFFLTKKQQKWDECYCAHGERTDNDPKEKKGGGKKT